MPRGITGRIDARCGSQSLRPLPYSRPRSADRAARDPESTWLIALVAAAVLLRGALWLGYEPITYPDTTTYWSAAADLADGTLARSLGRRTPGYPLLIVVAQRHAPTVVALQMLGGVLSSVLLYTLVRRLTHSSGLAFAAALAFSLNLQQLFMESALISESVSTLSVMTVTVWAIHVLRGVRKRAMSPISLLVLGALAGTAVLVRPQFIFLVPAAPLLVLIAARVAGQRMCKAIGWAAIVATPAAACVLAWSAWVAHETGWFTLSTQAGMGVANHSVKLMEHAPESFEPIKSILLRNREIKLAEQGHYGNTAWLALPEMMAATGMNFLEVSRTLQRMSYRLFAEHPVLYAKSVALSWVDFWTVPIIWEPDRISPSWAARPLAAVWSIEQPVLRGANALFLLVTAAAALSWRFRRAVAWNIELTALCLLVLGSSAVQALADYGASGRYEVTVQALVVVILLVTAQRAYRCIRTPEYAAAPRL